MDPSFLEEFKTLAIQETENENSECIQLALSNTVVLWQIFKFLPANTLKNCGLVNKLWKNECYSYCRDKTKWVAKISEESPCDSLRDFNELIGSMAIVPYNGLRLRINPTGNKCCCPSNGLKELFTNVFDKLIWRHLDVHIDYEGHFLDEDEADFYERNPCAVLRFGMTVLQQKIGALESLRFQLDDSLQRYFPFHWPPLLPNLRSICFPFNTWSFAETPTSFTRRLTSEGINLEEIKGAINSERLQKIPEGLWACVKDFIYSHHPKGDNEIKILSQFVSKRPALEKLQLNSTLFSRPTADDPIFLELMQLSRMTLEDFHIRSYAGAFDPVGSVDVIGLPQLPKLRVLRLYMTSGFGQAIEKAQSLLNQHDGQVFPQLEEFHLSVDTIDERYGFRPRAALDIRPCFSVSKLRLELDPLSSSFVEGYCLFPAVTDMHIISQWYVEPSRLPYEQIFRLWQNLETLSIENEDFHSSYNLDSAFCGLHEEEVEYLRGKGNNFLGAVELVPIAPCVLTMRNLVKFTMECPPGREVSENCGTYMTKVARVLAQRYLPQTLVKVSRGAD